MRPTVFLIIFVVTIISSIPWRLVARQEVMLAWNPSPSPNVAGYTIHYGFQGDDLRMKLRLGLGTTAIIPGLIEGRTYYFEVTAYTSSGSESVPSNEAIYSVPREETETHHLFHPIHGEISQPLPSSRSAIGLKTGVPVRRTVTRTTHAEKANATTSLNIVSDVDHDAGGNTRHSGSSVASIASGIPQKIFQLRLVPERSGRRLPGGMTLTLQPPANLMGRIEVSTNLVNWLSWTNFESDGSVLTYLDSDAAKLPCRYYRAVFQ
jgi:hypothetical protein